MQIRKYVCAAGFVLLSTSAFGDVQYEQGQAALSYSGKSAPATIRDLAQQMAEMRAIETHYAKAGDSEQTNFDLIRSKVAENLDHYVLEASVVDADDRKDIHQYSVVVRAKLNLAALDNELKANSAVGTVARSAKSRMTFLVVARQASSETDFNARVFSRVDTGRNSSGSSSMSGKTTEGESVAPREVATNDSKSTASTSVSSVSTTVERGGSTQRKASETSWRIFPGSNMDSVLTGAFNQAGFRVTEAAEVEPYSGGKLHVATVQEDYKSGMDLKSQTLIDVETGLRTAKIPYLTVGTLDVGFANPDPATGLLRVAVTVNAKVVDLSDNIPDTVATVGPVQYAGFGPTEAEAQTNALKLAAHSASRELISQLTNAGIH